jgi:L-fuculose-phosphate aldolase
LTSLADMKPNMVRICHRMADRGFVAATDGNVSVKMGDRLLITPSGLNKGFVTEDDLIETDLKGRVITGSGRPSSEIRMHLLVYELRPDVGAVVHAHPPLATAFSLAGVSLARCILPEVVMTLGAIPTTDYATPTTDQVPEVIREPIKNFDAMILARHGTLTVGPDLMSAYNKLEKVEHTAEITLTARRLGGADTLPVDEIDRLTAMGRDLGLIGPETVCVGCGGCGRPIADHGSSGLDEERIAALVARELADSDH